MLGTISKWTTLKLITVHVDIVVLQIYSAALTLARVGSSVIDSMTHNTNQGAGMKDRIRVLAGKVKVGDEVRGRKVTEMGKVWSEQITDDTACCYGMEAGLGEYPSIKMQFIYFN